MERRNDIIKMAADKLAEVLDVDLLEAAHQVNHFKYTTKKFFKLLIKSINLNLLK
jgi:hypothetical protein